MNISITERIKELIDGVPGWTPEDQLFGLYMLAKATNHMDGDVWEIGSWCGRSSIVIADAIKATNSKLHCIDLFPNKDDWFQNQDGTFSFEVSIGGVAHRSYDKQTVWKEPYFTSVLPTYNVHGDNLQEIFRNTISSKGFNSIVSSFRGTSETFAKNYNGQLRMAFIDGDHSYEGAKKDILAVCEFLKSGGWIVFDDAFSVYEGVNEAINELIVQSGKFDELDQLTRKCFAARKK